MVLCFDGIFVIFKSGALQFGHVSGICPANSTSLFGEKKALQPHFLQCNWNGVGRIGMANPGEMGAGYTLTNKSDKIVIGVGVPVRMKLRR